MSGKAEIKQFNFREYAWGQFKKNRAAYISLWTLATLAVMALFAPIIANDQPLYASYKGHSLFPAFSLQNSYELQLEEGKTERIQLDIAKWKQMKLDAVIWAPVPYAPNKSDFLNSDFASPGGKQYFEDPNGEMVDMPGRFRHLLGTNKKGEDVLSGLIHAARISLSIGIIAMGIATVIGLVLGALAGYFGDSKLRTTRGQFYTFILGLVFAYYYAFMIRADNLSDAIGTSGGALLLQLLVSILIFAGICAVFYFLGKLVGKLPLFRSERNIPVDSFISRMIEILISIPRMVLIISIAAVAKPSIINLMLIIGFTSWTGIARFTRAEFLKIRNLEYIQAGQSLGFSEMRIIFRHALPNGVAPALVAIAFGVASAILIESSLSFLGVGVPPDVVTWGSLISSGRENFAAWWLVIFPGIAIILTVAIYNLLGEGLRDATDPKLKT
ncbi:MAG: ABC transporter permease subunit [Flavobacteriales bacterium]|nr:ABC transporter permease subunit [Flavobacteriales bacterium]